MEKQIRLAVVLPSRGLIFSETVEELYRELNPFDFKIFWSHGNPIPDCFETPTAEALKDKTFSHLLVVEEDMILPEGIVMDLIAADTHAIACDYPVTGKKGGTVLYDRAGNGFFTGCGLLLVRMDLIRAMKRPIWRDDLKWNMKIHSDHVSFNIEINQDERYGQQDIAFGLRLYANGFPIRVHDKTIGQRKIEGMGEGRTNFGYHDIMEWTEIIKHDHFMLSPRTEDTMHEIELDDGTTIFATPEQTMRLVSQGKAKELKIGDAKFTNTQAIEDWLWL